MFKIITSIEKQKKNETRYNLYLDGEFCCGIELETIMKNHLKENMQIDEEQLKQIVFESDLILAFSKASKLLSTRLKTEKEMQGYLLEKGFSDDVANACISKLKEYKYIDDEQYINSFINSNLNTYSKNKIKQKLIQKKIDKNLINKFLDFDENLDVMEKEIDKFLKYNEKNEKNKNRIIRRLISKGYSFDDTLKTVNKKFEE